MKTMISKYIFVLFLAAGFLLSTSEAAAREYDKDNNNTATSFLAKQAEGRGIATWINVNGVSSFFDWQGITGYNPNTRSSGTEYPKYQVGVIYRDGLVWGGLVRDPARARQKFVDGNTYVVGTIPGKIIGGAPEDWEAQSGGGGEIRVYRIRADWRSMGTAAYTEDAAAVFNTTQDHITDTEIAVVKEQYGLDWNDWPTDRGAPSDSPRTTVREPPRRDRSASRSAPPDRGSASAPVRSPPPCSSTIRLPRARRWPGGGPASPARGPLRHCADRASRRRSTAR